MSQFNQQLGPVALGDQFSIVYPLLADDGQPWTPAAEAAEWRAKLSRDDDDEVALIAKALGAGIEVQGSTATVTVLQEDQAGIVGTVTLWWSLRITDADLGPVTPGAGTIRLVREAVRT
ncbi:MAG TPA: hypothetical protein VIL10_05315 [Marmoricola sp.]